MKTRLFSSGVPDGARSPASGADAVRSVAEDAARKVTLARKGAMGRRLALRHRKRREIKRPLRMNDGWRKAIASRGRRVSVRADLATPTSRGRANRAETGKGPAGAVGAMAKGVAVQPLSPPRPRAMGRRQSQILRSRLSWR